MLRIHIYSMKSMYIKGVTMDSPIELRQPKSLDCNERDIQVPMQSSISFL